MLSKRAVETLLDLVEIKLSCIEVYDRDDSRELANLEQCKRELIELGTGGHRASGEFVPMDRRGRGRMRLAHTA